jgi:transketolase
MTDHDARFRAEDLRRTVLRMAYAGSTVHIGCAFSIVEILAVLHRSHLRLGDAPGAPGRDYLVLSKGHGVMAQYACLHELGWLTDEHIDGYFGDGTILKGLSDAHVPGLEVTSGSLGHGLSVGVGLAYAAQRDRTGQRTYAIVGDGELDEGPIWEAAMFAAHHGLEDLFVIIDANGHQAMGTTDEVLRLGDVRAKFEAFGFDAHDVDGHDEAALHDLLADLEQRPSGRPRALVASTVKGYGVSFMADDNRWHYTRLDDGTYAAALAELDATEARA